MIEILLLVLGLERGISAQASESDISKLASSREWKLLLHLKPAGSVSEADAPSFFFHPEGRTDPVKEMQASIEAFRPGTIKRIGPFRQHPQCAFPERFRFLNKNLNLNYTSWPCPEFEKWRAMFRTEKIFLIYAAPYMGSPASMFGHSFLRIGSASSPHLDHALSFEAYTGPSQGLGYALKGVLGLYPGFFNIQPHYLKLSLYTDLESRDLWEYELNLSSSQIDRILGHVWELSNTHFNYYFFDENCSYHILSLLEWAEPGWHLRDHFSWMAVPADTVRIVLSQPGSYREARFRPSLTKRIEARILKMSREEHHQFRQLKDRDHSHYLGLSALVLDALLDYKKFDVLNRSEKLNDPKIQVPQELLLARAQNPAPEWKVESAIRSTSPEQSHGTSKWTVMLGRQNQDAIYGFEYRPVLHDETDFGEGYLDHSRLVLAETAVEYRDERLSLTQFTVAEVAQLSPSTAIQNRWAWRIGAHFIRPQLAHETDALAFRFEGAIGKSLRLGTGILYGLAGGRLEASHALHSKIRLGQSAELGWLHSFGTNVKIKLSNEFQRYFENESEDPFVRTLRAEIHIHNKSWDLGLAAESETFRFKIRERFILSLGSYF